MHARVAEFLAGGLASCLAEVLTLPLDTIKVRIMMARRGEASLWSVLKRALSTRAELWDVLFQGLDAALLRQLVFGTLRFGMFPVILQLVTSRSDLAETDTTAKVIAGFFSGAISSAICNPTDLVKVRLQGQGSAKYGSAVSALWIISRDEGLAALWTGVWPTVYRSSVIAAVELSSYHTIKGAAAAALLLSPEDTLVCVLAAMLASVLTAVLSCPFDVARSRMMNQLPHLPHLPQSSAAAAAAAMMKRSVGGPRYYRNTWHCLVKSVRDEGLGVLWNGLGSYFLRLGPNAVFTYLFLERIRAVLLQSR